ncbi:MAG: short-chain dehydrogenase [Candidatus Poribacteria bacterium]|nr:MAG: short-chain dehydrogenase [Candidatus Poribacteria bacterium]
MNLGIQGRSAVVCAASRGLGYAVARGLAQEGARLTICSRVRENIERAAERIRQETGAEVVPVVADVSDPHQALQVVSEARKAYGQVDILVTNAGGPPPGGLFETPPERYDQAHRLTLMSVVTLVRAVAEEMKARRWGRIVNLTSMSVKEPVPSLILSNTARAAVVAFAKTAATELAPYNVTVNNIATGFILTERITELATARAQSHGTSPEEEVQKMAAQIPMGRMGRPEELANVVVFLASEAASYLTGATIQVDGGLIRSLL